MHSKFEVITEDICHVYYNVDTFRKAYSEVFHPLPKADLDPYKDDVHGVAMGMSGGKGLKGVNKGLKGDGMGLRGATRGLNGHTSVVGATRGVISDV